ncbi:MAG: tyrosine-type recombinase/integrase [Desulfobacterales bacterium]|nr:tyrosine-type recombinase/integrase [Desulfobacterales bacterium]
MDKIYETTLSENSDSIVRWANLYFAIQVVGGAKKTEAAKQKDLDKFLSFFCNEMGSDHVDGWTPVVTRQFQKKLQNTISNYTGQKLKATTINRTMATIRHFGRWLNNQRKLMAGDPFADVKDIIVDLPDWNGLTSRQVIRIKAACEQRIKYCIKRMQNPLLEVAVIYVLLHTGLRAGELTALNIQQYHHRAFHNVLRKGKRITNRVPLPAEARAHLDRYLKDSREGEKGALLVNRYRKRLSTQDVARICTRIANHVSSKISKKESFCLTPHMFRHTFLKRVADKHGIHYAQRISGNISMREIFRYTQPSDQEIAEDIEKLFEE